MTETTPRLTVLVTGASSGIGRAATIEFVARGYRVIAAARSIDKLQELAEAQGADVVFPIPLDVTDPDSARAMADRVLTEFGVPDVVVANAGIGLDALFSKTTDEALRQVFEVNVFGLVRSVRPFVEPMIERGSGRILLVSSIVGKRGIPYYSAYSASKFALHGMAEALRSELVGSGVTVGLVCPSSTESGFRDNLLHEGPGQNSDRLRRHSAESVARIIAQMAGNRRHEVIIGAEAKLLYWANRLAPGLLDRIIANKLKRRE